LRGGPSVFRSLKCGNHMTRAALIGGAGCGLNYNTRPVSLIYEVVLTILKQFVVYMGPKTVAIASVFTHGHGGL
jgi:hypothetical protein